MAVVLFVLWGGCWHGTAGVEGCSHRARSVRQFQAPGTTGAGQGSAPSRVLEPSPPFPPTPQQGCMQGARPWVLGPGAPACHTASPSLPAPAHLMRQDSVAPCQGGAPAPGRGGPGECRCSASCRTGPSPTWPAEWASAQRCPLQRTKRIPNRSHHSHCSPRNSRARPMRAPPCAGPCRRPFRRGPAVPSACVAFSSDLETDFVTCTAQT